jgi:WD40 repeat protein
VGDRWALSGSDDRTLRLWDLDTGSCLAFFTFDNQVKALAVVDRLVIAGDTGGNVHFLDLVLPDS